MSDSSVVDGRMANDQYSKPLSNKLIFSTSTSFFCGCEQTVSFRFVLRAQQIKVRADKTGSSSFVYLANTLREVIQVAHHLIATNSPTSDGGEGTRPGVVVEYTPRGEKALRLRLTVPKDGAVAP